MKNKPVAGTPKNKLTRTVNASTPYLSQIILQPRQICCMTQSPDLISSLGWHSSTRVAIDDAVVHIKIRSNDDMNTKNEL
jgi:hypothetical protein